MVDLIKNEELEEIILNLCATSKDSRHTILGRVTPADFTSESYRRIYEVVLKRETEAQPVDFPLLTSSLGPHFEPILRNIRTAGASVSNTDGYIKELLELSEIRGITEFAGDLSKKVQEGTGSPALLDYVSKFVFGRMTDRREETLSKVSDDYDSVIQKITSPQKGDDSLKTSIGGLNKIIGGLDKDELIVVAGRPSMGKSELSFQIALEAAMGGVPVLIYSLEQPKDQIIMRNLATITGINLSTIKNGDFTPTDVQNLKNRGSVLRDLPIYIDDDPTITITDIVLKSRRLKSQVKDLGLIVFDYIQLLEMVKDSSKNRNEAIGTISRTLKILNRTLKLPIIVVSQLNRDCDKRPNKRPFLSDLRESGSIEQDADIVIFCYSDFNYTNKREDMYKAELIVAKHRNGPIGACLVTNDKPHQKFYDRDAMSPETLGVTNINNTGTLLSSNEDLPF